MLTFLAAPDYENPTDADADNVYDVTVQVSDGAGGTDSQAVAVTVAPVNDNNPVITSNGGGATASVGTAENSTAVTTVTATDSDLPAQTLTYSITGGADAAKFAINGSTGELTFLVAPDSESPADVDADNVYEVIVQVADGAGGGDTQTLSIAVADLDEFDVGPVTDSNAAANTVAENAGLGTTVGLTGLAGDADATATISYSLDDNAGGRFAIDGTTGLVAVNGVLDYETATSHSVTIRATSSDGSYSTQSFTIAVTNVNESGITAISDADGAADLVLENSVNGTPVGVTAFADDPDGTDTVSYSLDDDAGGRFAIHSATGEVTVAGALDREAAGSYAITVRATSTDTTSTTRTFTITLGDVDEFDITPISDADPAADAVDENAAIGAALGITALAADADATTNGIAYSLDDNAGGQFAIDPATGMVSVAGAIDREAGVIRSITIRATSNDGSTVTQNYTITIRDMDEFDITPIATPTQRPMRSTRTRRRVQRWASRRWPATATQRLTVSPTRWTTMPADNSPSIRRRA